MTTSYTSTEDSAEEHAQDPFPTASLLRVSCDLTVVVPTRNEQDNIIPLLEELQKALDGVRAEIIFVDDSDDDTPQVIVDATAARETPTFRICLEHRQPGSERTGGLATAVVRGMDIAQAKYVAVIDADLQHPPALLRVFYEKAIARDADLVLASRYMKGGSNEGLGGVGRHLASLGFKWLAKVLFPGKLRRVSDPLGGFFLLKHSLLEGVVLRPIGYKILLEVLVRCSWQRLIEVPYRFRARTQGQSKADLRQGLLALQHMWQLLREVPVATGSGTVWRMDSQAESHVYNAYPGASRQP